MLGVFDHKISKSISSLAPEAIHLSHHLTINQLSNFYEYQLGFDVLMRYLHSNILLNQLSFFGCATIPGGQTVFAGNRPGNNTPSFTFIVVKLKRSGIEYVRLAKVLLFVMIKDEKRVVIQYLEQIPGEYVHKCPVVRISNKCFDVVKI